MWICHYYCCQSLLQLKNAIAAFTTAAGPATTATAAPAPVAAAAAA
jgi:hypothetical protein